MQAPDAVYDLQRLRQLTPDFVPCRVGRREHHFSLGLGLTSRCNFRCPGCYYHGPDGGATGHDMPLPLLEALLAPLPRLTSIVIGLEGEPLCHPRLFDALDCMATRADRLSLISNGSLLDAETCKRLSGYPIGFFALSIDAGDDIAYRHFRKGGELATFRKNGRALVERLGERVCLHAVVFAENMESLSRLPEVAATMGVKWISLQQLRETAGTAMRMVHRAQGRLVKEGLKKIIATAEKQEVILVFEQRFGNKEIMCYLEQVAKTNKYIRIEPQTTQFCPQILQFTSVFSNGQLFPCCGDFSPHDISEYSFDGIFNHEYLQRLRFLHAKKEYAFPACKLCRAGS